MSPLQIEQQWLHMTAKVTERLCWLPAVAHPDWCDRAARCFGPIAERGVIAVLIATITPAGGIDDREAVGASHEGSDGGVESHVPNLIRSRADRLTSLGFTLSSEAIERGFCGSAERFSLPRDWRAGSLGRMWGEVATGELLIAGVPVGTRVPGRMALVMIARHDATTGLAGREGVLTATMPVLGRRALTAIGAQRTTSGDWLTAREQMVLERLTLGMSVADIAEESGRSSHTIHDHVKSLHKKLAATTRGELIARALGHITEVKPRTSKRRDQEDVGRVEELKPGGARKAPLSDR